jgi:hypothetical protein
MHSHNPVATTAPRHFCHRRYDHPRRHHNRRRHRCHASRSAAATHPLTVYPCAYGLSPSVVSQTRGDYTCTDLDHTASAITLGSGNGGRGCVFRLVLRGRCVALVAPQLGGVAPRVRAAAVATDELPQLRPGVVDDAEAAGRHALRPRANTQKETTRTHTHTHARLCTHTRTQAHRRTTT